ncbi:MAG: hypothetical protein HIU85_14395 [Proteobacteria bacterium]|nr:hypothetical protein [Pseudomonadota bacterium]
MSFTVANKSRTAFWMAGAYLGSLAIAAGILWTMGAGQRGTLTGLQLTARWSYLFFLAAYTGGALTTVFGPVFQPLARRGRDLGLAFASAHLTHLCFVLWDYHISAHPPVPTSSAIYFGLAAVFTYLLALFSIPGLAAELNPHVWWALRTLGMDYIAIAFLRDFLHDPFNGSLSHLIGYLPFIALGSAAVAVRVVAYAKRLRRWWLAPAPAG